MEKFALKLIRSHTNTVFTFQIFPKTNNLIDKVRNLVPLCQEMNMVNTHKNKTSDPNNMENKFQMIMLTNVDFVMFEQVNREKDGAEACPK